MAVSILGSTTAERFKSTDTTLNTDFTINFAKDNSGAVWDTAGGVNIANGDIIMVAILCDISAEVDIGMSPPAGANGNYFRRVCRCQAGNNAGADGDDACVFLFAMTVVDVTNLPSNWDFTMVNVASGNNGGNRATGWVVRGGDIAQIVHSQTCATATQATSTIRNVASQKNNEIFVCLAANNNNLGAYTVSNGTGVTWTSVYSTTVGGGFVLCGWATKATAGSVGDIAFTKSGGSSSGVHACVIVSFYDADSLGSGAAPVEGTISPANGASNVTGTQPLTITGAYDDSGYQGIVLLIKRPHVAYWECVYDYDGSASSFLGNFSAGSTVTGAGTAGSPYNFSIVPNDGWGAGTVQYRLRWFDISGNQT